MEEGWGIIQKEIWIYTRKQSIGDFFFHPDWKEYLTKISKERSCGPKTYWGKLKVSMNARKYFGAGGRFNKNSLFMDFLISGKALSTAKMLGNERMIKIIEKLMKELN